MKARKILSLGAITLLTLSLTIGCAENENTSEEVTNADKTEEKVEFYETPEVSNTDDALEILKVGNKRFVEDKMENFNLGFDKREFLASGQSPHTVVVACSDSRVAPEHVFDQGLGDLFVIRVAGNILSEEEIGSIEYAVEHLDSPLVVLMGHEKCGAVTAAVDSVDAEESEHTANIDAILNRIKPAVEKVRKDSPDLRDDDLVEKSIEENVELTLKNLVEHSDLVVDKVREGKLKILGAKYHLDTGEVLFDDYYSLD